MPAGALAGTGIAETRPLQFHSPYGCSKGAADQYVLDYARSYGLATCVFRMSCIYGPHQNGTEDQGWVAHFLIRAMQGRPITIYGDGKQVRDLLFVDDLVDALTARRATPARDRRSGLQYRRRARQHGQPAGADRADRGVARRAPRRSNSAIGGSATSAGTCPTPRKFGRRPGGGRRSGSRRASGCCMTGCSSTGAAAAALQAAQ